MDGYYDGRKPSLYLIRLVRDTDDGVKPEPAIRKQLEVDYFTYCRVVLAEQLLDNRLREWGLLMVEFGDQVNLKALILREMAADFSSWISEHDNYNWSPYGPGASGFGYDSAETVAWLIPHRSAPAIFWRKNDEFGSGRVMTWLNRTADDIEDGLLDPEQYPFPTPTEEGHELLYPEETKVEYNRVGRARRTGTY